MQRLRDMLIDLAVMAFIALMLALLGPFGMFDLPLGIRLIYWLIVGIGGYLLYHPAIMVASRLAPRLELPTAGLWAATCLLMSLPMTALIWMANHVIGRPDRFNLADGITLYGNIVIVAGIVCLIFWFATAKRRAAIIAVPARSTAYSASKPVPAESARPPAAAFLDRLPPQIGDDLIALEMEDHYVRAHTAHGSALILLRLRDAVSELGPIDGAQVHRSWWVARGAVEHVLRDGRNTRLQLRGGLIAPVARNATAELKAKGWL